jgi:hypothetical protein
LASGFHFALDLLVEEAPKRAARSRRSSSTCCKARRKKSISERSILGAILLDNLAYSEAAVHVKPEDFSLDSHRRIFTRMVDLAESSRPTDMITLVEELDRRKELEAIGAVGYISGLVDGVPNRPSIAHYVHHRQREGAIAWANRCRSGSHRAGFGR